MAKKKKSEETISPELETTPAIEIETPTLESAAAESVKEIATPETDAASELVEAAESEAEEDASEEADEEEDDEAESGDEAEDFDEEADEEVEADDEDEDEEIDGDDDESDEDAIEEDETEEEPVSKSKPRPPAKPERLQKILAQAGVASRRSAEAMIEQGRVQVNGKVVTELGTKADAGRDHIRVDGKLLQGAERLRYFVLNKPKGFVTTVKDPEGRPTVMQFFDKMRERLYPVGRLDYMSEGLLLVTNDGELANRLTKASSGVEKTYLVKVAGQPTEDELDLLRGGVSIPRGKPGTPQVRTSPARIRQVRQGDNPWYEVVLIEGRNRELRKMFEEVGHFVEKIRRIGYGPLVLDQEPGNLRELDEQELTKLRLAAEGKLRTPKSKEVRRRNAMDAQLPTVEPRRNLPRAAQPFGQRSAPSGDFRPKKSFGAGKPFESDRSASSARPSGDRPASRMGSGYRPSGGFSADRRNEAPRRPGTFGPAKFGSARTEGRPSARPAWQRDERPAARFDGATSEGRPSKSYGDRPSAAPINGERTANSRSFAERPAGKSFGDKPSRSYGDKPARSFGDKPRTFGDKPAGKSFGNRPAGKSFGDRPAKSWGKPGGDDRSGYKRPALSTRADDDYSDLEPRKPVKIFIEPIQPSERSSRSSAPRPISDRPYSARSSAPRSGGGRPSFDRSSGSRPYSDRPRTDRPSSDRPKFDRPNADRPARSEGGMERRFTTSSGQPRAGGARPSSKPGRSSGPGGGRPSFGAKPGGFRPGGSSRPSFGQSRPSFRRDEGSPGASRTSTPRSESTSDYRPTAAKPYPSSASRAERKAGGDWKPKTHTGGAGKPSFGRSSKPGGFSKSGSKGSSFKSKPGGKKRF
jgi:23S rRNA pseudouridine2605 synthase